MPKGVYERNEEWKATRRKEMKERGTNKFTEEHKVKISKNHADCKGFKNPMYSKKHTPESIVKMKKTHTGKKHTPEHKAKLSIAQIGKKHTPETIAKISGENHHNWLGGSSFEPYGLYWSKGYRQAIRDRDGNVCQLCGKTEERNEGKRLSVHHINYDKECTDPNTKITLCMFCHTKTTNTKRQYWQNLLTQIRLQQQPKIDEYTFFPQLVTSGV